MASNEAPRPLVVGEANHKTGQGGDEREAMARLERYVQERFHVEAIEHQWSAEFLEPADGLPYIGRLRTTRHVMTGAGYSGTGLTYGSVAGRVLADLHLGRESELAEIFSPSRFKPIAAALDYLSENLNVAKHFVADRFSGDTIEVERIREHVGLPMPRRLVFGLGEASVRPAAERPSAAGARRSLGVGPCSTRWNTPFPRRTPCAP